ncbi:MAG: nitrite/sulfite reductase [Alphaproteobacteria bacterium]|nr:nitrite/sulfite reductase [Alphaproteobacteria bacterium]
MYRYDEFDRTLVKERVAQFRGQVARRVAGELTEDEFRPLRLMNGLYLQLHAYMLRVAVPYGTLSSRQMRMLAHIARTYDKGYGHFTTRQNIQYNWPRLGEVPDILDDLASVEMHAIQTSGNCIRNVTSDQYAGAIAEEIEDPRPWAELIRQWSTFHPEFSYLPRKFKIAVTGSPHDRAAVKVHDIGLDLVKSEAGEIGFRVHVGGGQGRTPMIAMTIREFLPKAELLAYLEAVMRTYNRLGRRDNLFKARIKILVHETGQEKFRAMVDEEYALMQGESPIEVPPEEVARIVAYFAPPAFERLPDADPATDRLAAEDRDFAAWLRRNVKAHRAPGYAIVDISLKPIGGVPGDATADQMDLVADLAETLSFDELRVTHEQNLVLPHVRKRDLPELWRRLKAAGLATPNMGLASDIIACPGLDYCNLANARSIPIAQKLSERLADQALQEDLGELKIKISGCINACGHHHVGHIGILGVDRKGTEYYQISLGGSADENTSLGEILGPSFTEDDAVEVVDKILGLYRELRENGESFLQCYRRVGARPFKERIYGAH